MSLLSLQHISKDFGNGKVLDDLCMDIEQGEFLTMLGPSGCGKTTTLRIIAGLEAPNEGRVLLEGKDITALPPEKRPLNTVFQNYALFPHMNVEQNIAYGLRVRGVSRQERLRLAGEALALVRLSGYEKRMPRQLSGGQRQRVAIARAAVLRPRLLLLDEPLGALDLKLRQEMQKELKQLQKQLGITFIYITHDQEEALNMSSRIALMNRGKIEQIGTPREIYGNPRTLFAADFIGQSNLLHGVIEHAGDRGAVLRSEGIAFPVAFPQSYHPRNGEKAVLCLRPQSITLRPASEESSFPMCEVLSRDYTGSTEHIRVRLNERLTLNVDSLSEQLQDCGEGTRARVMWNPEAAPLVPDSEEA